MPSRGASKRAIRDHALRGALAVVLDLEGRILGQHIGLDRGDFRLQVLQEPGRRELDEARLHVLGFLQRDLHLLLAVEGGLDLRVADEMVGGHLARPFVIILRLLELRLADCDVFLDLLEVLRVEPVAVFLEADLAHGQDFLA